MTLGSKVKEHPRWVPKEISKRPFFKLKKKISTFCCEIFGISDYVG